MQDYQVHFEFSDDANNLEKITFMPSDWTTTSYQNEEMIEEMVDEIIEESIKILLLQAREDINALRLTSPEGNNALEKYQQIFELDSENTEAKQGLQTIVDKYIGLAQQAANNGEYDKAIAILDKADKILPDSENIKTLRKEVGLKIKEEEEQRLAEKERQRQAEEERQRLEEDRRRLEIARQAEIERTRQEEAKTPSVTVIFYRIARVQGILVNAYITHNDTQIAKVSNGSSFVYSTTPGRHTFRTKWGGMVDVNTFEFEPRQTYFIRITYIRNSSEEILRLVSEAEGSAEIKR